MVRAVTTGGQNEDIRHADGGDQMSSRGMRDWSGEWCNSAAAFRGKRERSFV